MDKICLELKKDPVEFRLKLFEKAKSSPVGNFGYKPDKNISVVKQVAEMANWGNTPSGVYRDFATWFSFDSYVAQWLK